MRIKTYQITDPYKRLKEKPKVELTGQEKRRNRRNRRNRRIKKTKNK